MFKVLAVLAVFGLIIFVLRKLTRGQGGSASNDSYASESSSSLWLSDSSTSDTSACDGTESGDSGCDSSSDSGSSD